MIDDFIARTDAHANIFTRFGVKEPDGTPVRVTSHQFRHWLNTLAQEGGISQELIARWSGRKDMNQNSAYDHVPGHKLAENLRGLLDSGGMKGPIADTADRLPPADRAEFIRAAIGPHVTEVGLCIHDWSLTPCPTHGDCPNCTNEHVVNKGNAAQRAEAERQLAEVTHMLALAEREAADGALGASRWVEAQRRQ